MKIICSAYTKKLKKKMLQIENGVDSRDVPLYIAQKQYQNDKNKGGKKSQYEEIVEVFFYNFYSFIELTIWDFHVIIYKKTFYGKIQQTLILMQGKKTTQN